MQPYQLACLFAVPAAISITVGLLIWRQRRSQFETLLVLLMFSTGLWALGYSLELASGSRLFYWMWGVVQYLGITTAPLVFFLLMIHYAGLQGFLTKNMYRGLWSVPVVSIALRATDPLQGFIHKATTIHHLGAFTFQIHTPGPWFWVQVCYSYLLLFSGIMILLYFRSTARMIHRRHMTLLAAGSVAPFLGSLAYITGYRPMGFLDLTPLSFTFTGLAAAWGVLANRVLEIMPVARTALVDSFPDGLLMLDRRGRIVDMNATAGQMLNLDVHNAMGEPVHKVLAQWPALLDLCNLEAEGKVEMEDHRRNLGTLYLEARLTFVRPHADEVSARLIVLTDVTARKRVEEQLREAMKMEAVGQLAGGVAHDFNNLLQVINGNVELALNEIAAQHPAYPLLQEVAKGGNRGASLVRQLLAFGRRQIIRPEHLNLNEVVVSFLSILNRLIGEHIRVDFVPAASLGTIFADRGQIEQVLMNLSINARDAMPEGGTLRFETARVVLDAGHSAGRPRGIPGEYVMLSVADNGTGMDPFVLEHAWEPFFTTKQPGKGTGLGLSTVYGIVQQHGGFAEVQSRPGEGSTFRIYFPEQDTPPLPIEAKEQATPETGRETILVAEDEDTVRRLATRILERAGYNVIAACDGRQAIDMAAEHEGRIHLALLDVVMPVLGGRAAYEQLKQLYPRMKFLFFSGYNVDTVNATFVLDQGLDLVQKPFERIRLLQKIRELLDRP
ncbi:MAG: ATP-binding protein [Candidatus Hydrogenedentes bacterium]|nr:ATP-binding protein [Candidatus Hydrogenedentota bacterium]